MAELIKLNNGVRVWVDPMDGLESAAVGIWVRAGAIDEAPEENGVAHLLEHMAFKGTAARTARQIAEDIENVGGYLNASTGYSKTGYYARVLKADIALAFEILADILTAPLFDEDELAKEREVVVQEIGEAADAPDDSVMDVIQSLCFGDHALGR
ncbi:MAG TPA: pitrilysin family protein, partial [Parvularculaceae bacterium]|nr:pitrilysin family protein [Parvularculaceae bacterium]